jgi:hypothetical protein
MGLFCANFHFKTADDRAVSEALQRRGLDRYVVVPARGGWTTMYEQRASEQDDEWICELAEGLSKDLQVAAIAFLVHDSDIACYWLFDQGGRVDQYNSSPDYFDSVADDEPAGPAGGQPDVLLRYCRAGVQRDELGAMLAQDSIFAEGVIENLAEALGIDPERALTDYRDVADAEGDGGGGDWDNGDDDDDPDGDDQGDHGGGTRSILPFRAAVADHLTKIFGSHGPSGSADPKVLALLKAAMTDDTDAIERLVAEGVPVDAEGPAELPLGQPMAGLGQLLSRGAPSIAMTPLLAAVIHKKTRATERLLDHGADLTRNHPLFGTPLHVTTGAGEVELLELLIRHGGDVSARNPQGQTPLEIIAAGRASIERLQQAQAMMESMGIKIPGIVAQMSNMTLPTEGWDACERVLRAHGAK